MHFGRAAASAALIMAISTGAALADTGMYAVYSSSGAEVKISGSFDSVGGAVTVMILPSEEDKSAVTAEKITKKKYITKQGVCGENGEFSFSINMPQYLASGNYTVYAACEGEEAEASFSHVSRSDVEAVLKEINSAKTAAELEKILSDNAEKVGLGKEVKGLYGHISRLLFSVRPSGGYSADSFLENKSRAAAIALLASGGDFKDVLTSYGEYFGFSYEAESSKLSDDCLKKAAELFLSAEPKESLNELFWQTLLFARADSSASYVEMRSAVEDYAELASLDLSGYNHLSEVKKTAAMKTVFSKGATSFSELSDFILAAVREQENKKDNNSSSSGGGGGGGGGSSSKSGGAVSSIGSTQPEKTSYSGFSDMENHWGREYVERLAKKGIVLGFEDNTYRPEKCVTRAEYIKLVVCALGTELTENEYFTDVLRGDWYFKYISAAKEAGLAGGFDGLFRPNDLITREDAAVILSRASGKENAGGAAEFSDSADISDYAKQAVGQLSADGIINGVNSEFLPKKTATRAEAAAMICRFSDKYGA